MSLPPRIVVGTAGHIDHGKSALVKALTGTDPDRLPEEKARGITIDLGFAHAAWDGVVFSFVDVPGHERFVKTMVAGAHGIDVALFVIATDDAVMPQTREHLAILQLLGVANGVIARTKSDLVDPDAGALVDDEVRQLVKGTFLERAPLVPVSALTGAGLDELRRALTHAAARTKRRARTVTRLPVDRVFTMKGFGPVVTGTLAGGSVGAEDRLVTVPGGHDARVRRVEGHGEEKARAVAGERTSLNLAGVDLDALERGQTLVAPDSLTPSTLLTVRLALLPAAGAPLADGAVVRLHHLTADVPARVRLLGDTKALAPGAAAPAQLVLAEPLAALRGDRFVIRRPSPVETLGGGVVLDPLRPRIRRRDAARLPVTVLEQGDDTAVATLLLGEAGLSGLDARSLAHRLGVTREEAVRLLESLSSAGKSIRLAPGLVAEAAHLEEARRRVTTLFAERAAAGAPSPFVPRGEVLERLGRGLPPAAAEGWLDLLARSKAIALDGDRVGPAGAASAEPPTGFAADVAEAFRTSGLTPPHPRDLAKRAGTKSQVAEGLVGHLIKQGILVRLSIDLVVHRDTVAMYAAKLAGVKGQTLSVGDFRDLLGLTRKTLIPLLEHFDQKKLTRRSGDARVVL